MSKETNNINLGVKKMTVSINGSKVLVDGIQMGVTFKNHETAIHQGKKMHEKHYPTANFVVVPEIKKD